MNAGLASLALQRALHGVLSGDAALSALITGVFDAVPVGTSFPYATLGNDLVLDWSSKSSAAREHRFSVTIWDDAPGVSRLKQIMAAVEQATAALPNQSEGFAFTGLHFIKSVVTRDPDGPGRGVIDFRVRSVPT